jgi:hypothetical protein
MRRLTRFCLIAGSVLLASFGAYTIYWWSVAGHIKEGLVAWRQSEKTQKIDASWQGLRVTGFPFAFRVEIVNASLRDRDWTPAPELHLASLFGSARPWDFDDWRLTAPDGFFADLASAGGRPALKLAAKSSAGTVSIQPQGACRLWLKLRDVASDAMGDVPVKSADIWVNLPAKPATKDVDRALGVAFDVHQLRVSAPPANLSHTIDELAMGFTVKGAVPHGNLAQAATAWRDAGGTIEVDNLHVRWSGLGISANGTLALDRQLQPIAAFSGGIEGFGVILNALVAADQLTEEQAALVQIALTSLAKPGPDGQPQITAPFTIQNGKMYFGPARLGKAPRIVWE